jgi:hypothetical protein
MEVSGQQTLNSHGTLYSVLFAVCTVATDNKAMVMYPYIYVAVEARRFVNPRFYR